MLILGGPGGRCDGAFCCAAGVLIDVVGEYLSEYGIFAPCSLEIEDEILDGESKGVEELLDISPASVYGLCVFGGECGGPAGRHRLGGIYITHQLL